MDDLIYKITEEVNEKEEEFIFTTINSWCESVMERKISKRDLERALVLYFNGGSILDKIRAEIYLKQYDFMANKDYDEGIRFGLMLAYQIIDKYKVESEDVDANEENRNKCSFCIHCEMCGWTEKYKNCGCECFDNGEEVLKQIQEDKNE